VEDARRRGLAGEGCTPARAVDRLQKREEESQRREREREKERERGREGTDEETHRLSHIPV